MNTNALHSQAHAAWRHSASICALADGERHLGHIVQIGGRWYAFDATHFNEGSPKPGIVREHSACEGSRGTEQLPADSGIRRGGLKDRAL
jgi:hypothetical protein